MNTDLKRDLKPTTFRLTPEARRLLKLLSQKKGISMTSVIETMIRKEAKEEELIQSTHDMPHPETQRP